MKAKEALSRCAVHLASIVRCRWQIRPLTTLIAHLSIESHATHIPTIHKQQQEGPPPSSPTTTTMPAQSPPQALALDINPPTTAPATANRSPQQDDDHEQGPGVRSFYSPAFPPNEQEERGLEMMLDHLSARAQHLRNRSLRRIPTHHLLRPERGGLMGLFDGPSEHTEHSDAVRGGGVGVPIGSPRAGDGDSRRHGRGSGGVYSRRRRAGGLMQWVTGGRGNGGGGQEAAPEGGAGEEQRHTPLRPGVSFHDGGAAAAKAAAAGGAAGHNLIKTITFGGDGSMEAAALTVKELLRCVVCVCVCHYGRVCLVDPPCLRFVRRPTDFYQPARAKPHSYIQGAVRSVHQQEHQQVNIYVCCICTCAFVCVFVYSHVFVCMYVYILYTRMCVCACPYSQSHRPRHHTIHRRFSPPGCWSPTCRGGEA